MTLKEIAGKVDELIDVLEGTKEEMDTELEEEREKDEIDEDMVDKLEMDSTSIESALAYLENARSELANFVPK